MTRFTHEDADRAYDQWGANCGPGALAAIMDLTLDEIRPHMGDFEAKGYTNPTLMIDCLKRAGAKFAVRREWPGHRGVWDFPFYGLCRVQWEGPWTEPGVPIRVRYRHTHWIGATQAKWCVNIGIFDINCINNGAGWVTFQDWQKIVVPLLTGAIPRANGKWHLTHFIEVERPAAATARAS